MKKFMKKFFLVAFTCALFTTVVACGEPTPEAKPGDEIYNVDYKAYLALDLDDVLASIGDLDELDATAKANVVAAYNAGKAAIEAAETNGAAYSAFKTAKANVIAALPKASDIQSYLSLPNSDRTEILGALEAYAVRNGITGISLFENGGYVMYNDRIKLGTENYITGYGFGTLTEGGYTASLSGETNAAYKDYYHTYDSSDPGTANALNDKGTQVSSVYSYIAGSFFTTFMNAEKNGYDWVPELAKTKPVAMVKNADGVLVEDPTATESATWRFEVRTDVKYSTNSKISSRAAFNNRTIELEDYLTPFKLLLTKANGYERGAEMASTTTGAIVGASAYYAASSTGFNAEEWEKVGLKVYEENGKAYFQYSYTQPTTQFYAMYYITSNLYQPIPQSFIDLVTPENYLGYNSDKTETPVDNSLSLGTYVLETWQTDKLITYSKNPNYVYAEDYYNFPGVHVAILTALATDETAAFKEFIAGKLDSCGIPQEYLDEYKNDPRTRTTTGDSNFKLNVNATDSATWEYLFGEKGVVSRTTKDQYWEVEPALSNPHFVKALSLSIDRLTFASARGSVGSVNYLSSAYMADPENNISYNASDAHKNAVATLLRDTDGNGYSLENAREYFKVALIELIEDGHYTPGTVENPTTIKLEIAWMYPQHETNYHNEIKQYLETAFNHESVHGNTFKLEVEFWVGALWSDVYYNKLMKGQYDLGFGAISGNTLNPLDFVSVLSSDQMISGNFTLNWGTNTNDSSADVLVYDGMQWSYDALWKAANTAGALIEDGNLVSPFAGGVFAERTENEDGTMTLTFDLRINNGEDYGAELTDVVLYYYTFPASAYYHEYSIKDRCEIDDSQDGHVIITVTITAEEVENLRGIWELDVDGEGTDYAAGDFYNSGYTGFDFKYTETIRDFEPSESVFSIMAENCLPQKPATASAE